MFEDYNSDSIYKRLEELDRLPENWTTDSSYYFENEGSLYFVIHFVKREAGRFILFRIDDFSKNYGELSSIMSALLCLEVEERHHEVIEQALGEVHSIIEAGGTGTLFFDAH